MQEFCISPSVRLKNSREQWVVEATKRVPIVINAMGRKLHQSCLIDFEIDKMEKERGIHMNLDKRTGICSLLVGALVLTSICSTNVWVEQEKKVDAATSPVTSQATVTEELTAKRSKFVKQFALSDGSFTAATYSMPVHYKKNGKWKEIDTTLVKSGKSKYKTKATDLSIKVSQKANKKSVVSMKRGKTSLSIALKGKKLKQSKRGYFLHL